MLNTVLDGDNHVAESFNGSAICYSSSCRNNLDRAVSPRFEGFQKAVKCAALRLVNLRIAASRKYLVPIDCGAYVEMHKAVRTTVSRLLMHEVDGFPIEIEGQDFRERHPGMLDPQCSKPRRRRRWRSHGISSQSLERVLVHDHECPATLPTGVAFGVTAVLWCYNHIPKSRLCSRCKDVADLRCTRRCWCPDQKRTVPANGSDHPIGCREYGQVRRNLHHANGSLCAECDLSVQQKGQAGEKMDTNERD